eukprot:m.30714 g.30714  ORF g.30714 m.30714 type:complete len:57 (-) comp13895_c0_seq5:735-905(-)
MHMAGGVVVARLGASIREPVNIRSLGIYLLIICDQPHSNTTFHRFKHRISDLITGD